MLEAKKILTTHLKRLIKNIMKKLHDASNFKRNEKFEIEFFEDKECTKPFDFKGKENLYLQLKDGAICPLTAMPNKTWERSNIYVPYIPDCQRPFPGAVKTLNDLTPNLSKYIPEDNAVLFLSEEDYKEYYTEEFQDIFDYSRVFIYPKIEHRCDRFVCLSSDCTGVNDFKKLTIFVQEGTQAEITKANEVGKYLWENFKIKPNLFVKDWFLYKVSFDYDIVDILESWDLQSNFNKIITTNSTGILDPQDSERLKVIDCKEIFEEHLNNSL